MALGPLKGGGEEQTLRPTPPRIPPHLSLGLSHLDCLLGEGAGGTEWVLEVILMVALLKLRDLDQLAHWAPLRDPDIT